MLSDPEAIRALYTAHEHGLPPGRTLSLLPIIGADSILLLEGPEHLARRKLMLPPFHGERMRSYESIMRDVTERELDRWPAREPFAIHPRMQAITLEVILRAVFGVTDRRAQRAAARAAAAAAGRDRPPRRLQLRFALARRPGRGGDPMARIREISTRYRRAAVRRDRRAPRRPGDTGEREDILSLLITARFEDGTAMSDRELRDQLSRCCSPGTRLPPPASPGPLICCCTTRPRWPG